jgi:hypothetical protein
MADHNTGHANIPLLDRHMGAGADAVGVQQDDSEVRPGIDVVLVPRFSEDGG